MGELNLENLSRYPFTRAAKDYVGSLNLTLEEILEHPVYSSGITLGEKRLRDAFKAGIEFKGRDRIEQELGIMAYAMARIIAHATKNRAVIKRYADAEARNAYNEFRKDPRSVPMLASDLDFKLDSGWMALPDYLHLSKNLAPKKWRLVNREMEKGRVYVGELGGSDSLELLAEAVKQRVAEPVETRNVPERFKELAEKIKSEVVGAPLEVKYKELSVEALPPCIKKMMASLEMGSCSHKDMFILGTFYVGLGLPVDDIVKVFSSSPKFDEEKTRYQLEFLAGEKGTTKYTCPTCAKIKSYGLCVQECKVKHPLKYYRDKTGRKWKKR